MRIAIMQPYFYPYAGYFRLFSRTELFVVYDCVQFPRRGWVHRNKLVDHSGAEQWLTLPLAKASRDVIIKDLAFVDDALDEMTERLRKFPLAARDGAWRDEVLTHLLPDEANVSDYLVRQLRFAIETLGLKWSVERSSSLHIDDGFRGQNRIIEICRRLGASEYVNASGGRDLYDAETFHAAGIELIFLNAYEHSYQSMLARLLSEDPADLRTEISDT